MLVSIGSNYIADDSNVKFFEILNRNTVFINGNLGIGTDIPLGNFHAEGITLNNKSIYIPSMSNVFNLQDNSIYYSLVPTGSILIYSGNTIPISLQQLGWYECNGQSLNANNFPRLKIIMTGQFGNPNPITTTIILPDLRDKVAIGSTTVGIIPISGTNPPSLTSPTIIQSGEINNLHTISLTYHHLPNHDHSGISEGISSVPAHTHTYVRSYSGGTVNKDAGTANASPAVTTDNTSSTNVPTPTHIHPDSLNSTSSTISLPVQDLGVETINIRQPNVSMIYIIKCN
jgi:microcystin-dependent protein